MIPGYVSLRVNFVDLRPFGRSGEEKNAAARTDCSCCLAENYMDFKGYYYTIVQKFYNMHRIFEKNDSNLHKKSKILGKF